MSAWSPLKQAWDVAFSFLLPTLILIVLLPQVKAFYGNRFNLVTSIVFLRSGLPDVFVLMVVGIFPDYLQGLIKLVWLLKKKTRVLPSTGA